MRLLFVVSLAVLLSDCSPPVAQKSTQVNDPVETLVSQKLGPDASISENKDGTFSLCQKERVDPANNMPTVRFIDRKSVV